MEIRRIAVAVAAIALWAAWPAGLQAASNSVSLTWTAPGDDGAAGTATQYDLRFSTTPISDANFTAATRVSGMPAPLPGGSAETWVVTGLVPATTYWFAIKTVDDAGNWSAISNILTATTDVGTDLVRPAALALVATDSTQSSISLRWTATGDDSLSGTATAYDLRWSRQPLDAANWSGATPVSGEPVPAAPGTVQSMVVTGLDRSSPMYFAMIVRDDEANPSALSNVVGLGRALDTAPPAAPTGVAADKQSEGGGTISVRVAWAANSEADLSGYHVFRALRSGGPFTKLNASVLPTNTYLDDTVPDTSTTVWYQISAVDQAGNESARSATLTVALGASGVAALKVATGYPNPSRPGQLVRIPIRVPASGPFAGTLVIANGAGEVVRRIAVTSLSPGVNEVVWDGSNDAGRATAPGAYHVWFDHGGDRATMKLIRTP